MQQHRVTMIAALLLSPSSIKAMPQSFDVASVKPSAPSTPDRFLPRSVRGGPGSSDPGLAVFENCDLFGLVTMAYAIEPYQLSGPDWLWTAKFDITAKVPDGATREQYREMLRRLLADRFKLALHHENKEMAIYELAIGKNGPKLKESPEDAADGSLQPPSASRPPKGYAGPVMANFTKISTDGFAGYLSGQLNQPVIDATGLKARYDIKIRYTLGSLQADATPGANAEPALPDVLREQLGLKLVPKKGMIDTLVIDRVEKIPTEN